MSKSKTWIRNISVLCSYGLLTCKIDKINSRKLGFLRFMVTDFMIATRMIAVHSTNPLRIAFTLRLVLSRAKAKTSTSFLISKF